MRNGGCETYVSDCHVRAAVDLISHTWDPVVLSALRVGPTRRHVLLERVRGLSDKVLTASIRRLIRRGLIERTPAGTSNGTAVYELTELGLSFAEGPLAELAHWAAHHQSHLAATA